MIQPEFAKLSDVSNSTLLEKAAAIKQALLKDVVSLNKMIYSRYDSVPAIKSVNFNDNQKEMQNKKLLSNLNAQTISSSFKKQFSKEFL